VQKLHFPLPDLRIRPNGDAFEVWDIVRKKWVALTPEEWVRQHLLHFLATERGWSISLMSIEKTLRYNSLTRRADLVTFNSAMQPLLLAECKAPDVVINQSVLDQAALYNRAMNVNYILVTNGLHTACCRVRPDDGGYDWLNDIPFCNSER
jgi:hypothetical protein